MPDPRRTDPGAHYDHITPAWSIICGDDFHHGLFDDPRLELASATERLTEAMAQAAALAPTDRVIDLGCGTGTQAMWLARCHPGVTVHGVSTSALGVETARTRSIAAGLADRVRFDCRDALDTGLPDAAYDVAWLLESSQYLVPRTRMMSECARLLVPGGRMALCDVMLARPLEFRDLRRLHSQLDVLRDTFGEAVMGTLQEYREAAVAAGLEITAEHDLTERVRPSFGRWRERARSMRPEVVRLIGEDGFDTFVAGCDAMETIFTEGVVSYGLIAAHKAGTPGSRVASGADRTGT